MTEKIAEIDLNKIGILKTAEKEELLEILRNEVDQIDKEIVILLLKRLDVAVTLGKIKKEKDGKTYSPVREKQIIEKISSEINDPGIQKSIQRIFERIIDESRAIQRKSV